MGATSSTSVDITNEFKNSISQKCSQSSYINQSINHVNIEAPPQCNIKFENRAAPSTECQIDALVDVINKVDSQIKTTTTAGLGFASSKDNVSIRTDVENYITQHCNDDKTINQNIQYINIKKNDKGTDVCGNIEIINAADPKSVCVLGAVQKMANDVTSKAESTTKGGSLLGGIFGDLGDISKYIYIIIGVILLVVIIGIVYKITQNKKKSNDDSPSENNSDLQSMVTNNISEISKLV